MAPLLLLSLLACKADEATEPSGPLGMVLADDGVTYAGVAVIDVTPAIGDTWTDLDGDHEFQGCLDDPTCGEPFVDVDGNGVFNPVWIGGFGPLRPGIGVHDPISARALVLSHGGSYVALVALDFVGLGSPRIDDAREALAADGFDPALLLVSSSHNHQGPDTMGLWGDPLDGVSGLDASYQAFVAESIEEAVRRAAAAMVPVDLKVGQVRMRDRGPWFNGPTFGGKNPDTHMQGMIHDGRDPVVVSDQLLVLQGSGKAGVHFTFTNWSGHPEVRSSSNNEISADWVGVTRDVLEAHYGGVALHMPECLGGMQSALGGDLPRVLPDGTHPTDGVDADGDDVPVWAERNSWDFVTSHGWHIAEAAIDALIDGEAIDGAPVRADFETVYVPIENVAYQLLGPQGLFELGLDDTVYDRSVCDHDGRADGCLPTRTGRLQIGPITFLTVPGELLPELAWGFPDDPRWAAEAADPTARGPGAAFFPQHDPACNEVDYAECTENDDLGDCDCLAVHAWPYRLTDDPAQGPMLDAVDTRYRAVVGMADNYLSYIIPEPDFNRKVDLILSERDGDHYEDTVSPAHDFATRLLHGQATIAERW